MAEEYFIIGQIVAPKGIKGQVKVYPLTDYLERFEDLERVYLDLPQGLQEVNVKDVSYQKNMIILSLEGYDDRNAVEPLRQVYLKVSAAEAVALPEGHYFLRDIIGLEVYTVSGEFWGKIEDVLQLYANDVYVLHRNGKEILIPAIHDVVQEINLPEKRMTIIPLEGLC